MVGTGQHNDLVAMHSDVADGYVILTSILRAITRVLDCGYNLQACVKQDQPLVSRETDFIHRVGRCIGPLRLLMHCTSVISLIVGEGRHRRQFIHLPVLSKLKQRGGWMVDVAHQESVVGERHAHGPDQRRPKAVWRDCWPRRPPALVGRCRCAKQRSSPHPAH